MTGSDLRRLRTEADLSQEALARAIGVRSLTVSRWERGLTAIKPAMESKVRRALEGRRERLDTDASERWSRAARHDTEPLDAFAALTSVGKAKHWPMWITPEELELVALLRQLSPVQRRLVLEEARSLAARKHDEAPVHVLNERGAPSSQRRPK